MKAFNVAALCFGLVFGAGVASADMVLYQSAGNSAFMSDQLTLPGAGVYRFEATGNSPLKFSMQGVYSIHYDIFLAPPPKPHEDFIDGNKSPFTENFSEIGGLQASFTFVVPETTYTFFNSSSFYEIYGVPTGTPVYREEKFEAPHLIFGLRAAEPGLEPFDYTLSITRLSAVPESATWTMMILGFGMAGTVFRARTRRLASIGNCH